MALPQRTCAVASAYPFAAAVAFTALWAAMAGASAQSPAVTLSGFLFDRGAYRTIDPPNARVTELAPFGINERGQIVGSYVVDASKQSGFVRDSRGRFTQFDVPGARATQAHKINNRGQIVGSYSENTASVSDPNARRRGFLLDKGRFTSIDVPGAAQTQAFGINNRGQVVGEYTDADGMVHGFLWDKGRLMTFDGPDGTGASFTDINDRGQIVGTYGDPGAGAVHGFLLSKGVYTTFDAPGVAITFLSGINDRGQIVGFTNSDLAGTPVVHGFLLDEGVEGPFTPIDFPGAFGGTAAFGIDDRGRIVGGYVNPDAAPDGQPSPSRCRCR